VGHEECEQRDNQSWNCVKLESRVSLQDDQRYRADYSCHEAFPQEENEVPNAVNGSQLKGVAHHYCEGLKNNQN